MKKLKLKSAALVLNRETLARLDADSLKNAAGGHTLGTCDCTTNFTCADNC